ncbi:hypothetical protein G9A89_011458 [Geosiphon pyriformis]|nr:hypothetical protein G9A89_011458 [Geosiphon pyriformis]
MKCKVAAYFFVLDLSIGIGISELVSSTMAEFSVVVYLDSQAALDVCVAELTLTSPDFCNYCWMKWCSIVNFIKKKRLDVFWCKIKKHLGVLDNEHADVLAGLAAGFDLMLSVLIEKKFIKAGRIAVFGNIQYIACEVFRSVNRAHWEVGSGS